MEKHRRIGLLVNGKNSRIGMLVNGKNSRIGLLVNINKCCYRLHRCTYIRKAELKWLHNDTYLYTLKVDDAVVDKS